MPFDPDTAIDQTKRRRGLMVMRALYFFYFGAIGAYWIFLNVYLNEVGLNGTQIGLVNTLSPLVSIISATLWGILNDRLGKPRIVLAIAVPGAILGCLAISIAPTFLWIIVTSCLMSLFVSAIIPLMDNTTLRLLGEERSRYGQIRVAGSVGFIITSLTSGYLYEITGLHWIFYTYALLMGLFLVCSLVLPSDPVRISGSVISGLGQMVRQAAWVIFALSALLLWISNNGTMNFIGIVVKEMGGSDSLVGWVWMMSAVAEIPIMFTSDRLLRRYGPAPLMVISFSILMMRGVLLAVMPVPEWAIGISTLGGISYSLFWVSAVNYANDSAPDHLKATAQGVLFSIMNLAGMAGSLSAGWLYDNLGFRGLFWVTAGFAAAALVLFVFGRMRYSSAASAQPVPELSGE